MNKTTSEQKLEIVNLYRAGETTSAIGKKYDISATAVGGILKRRNVQMRSPDLARRIYRVNDDFFDSINTQEKAYTLGFIYADGCNYPPRNQVSISQAEQDKDILDKITALIQPQKPLTSAHHSLSHQLQYRLSIRSAQISRRLKECGVVQRKTFQITFPNWLASQMIPHFVRGYFDGDGYIGVSKYRNTSLQIVGTESFCSSLQKIFLDDLNVKTFIQTRYPERNNNIRQLRVGGRKLVLRILDWMHRDSIIHGKRKYFIYQEIKNDPRAPENKPKRKCKLCDNEHYGKGYCRRHWYHLCGGKEKRHQRYLETGT